MLHLYLAAVSAVVMANVIVVIVLAAIIQAQSRPGLVAMASPTKKPRGIWRKDG